MQFLLVYIREAHPEGGRRPYPVPGHGLLDDPKTDTGRAERAGACIRDLGLDRIKTVVDGIDDKVGSAWAAWPDRLFLVGKDGRVAYTGEPGPRGFLPAQLEAAIKRELDIERAAASRASVGDLDSRPEAASRPAK